MGLYELFHNCEGDSGPAHFATGGTSEESLEDPLEDPLLFIGRNSWSGVCTSR
jgi:hypothetical protein